jgi:hypothetical protein
MLAITETGARLIEPGWTMNPVGNWWFCVGIAVVFTGLGWIVTERIVAPRLGAFRTGLVGRSDARYVTIRRQGYFHLGSCDGKSDRRHPLRICSRLLRPP